MNLTVNKDTWQAWARNIAYPSEPEEYCEAATERLMLGLSDYLVDVKNVRPQFKAVNAVRMITFANAQEADYYQRAFDRYLEATAKLEAGQDGGANSKFLILVEWLKFRQAAELIRADYMATQMYHGVKEGFASVAALCFKPSQAKIVSILNKKFGVPRDQISMIWGGSAAFTNQAGKRLSEQEIMDTLMAAAAGAAIDKKLLAQIKQQLTFDSEGLGNLSSDLRLGPQDYRQRQEEIDRFQSGKALYCLFNFKSGGVGLSLHHSDDMTQQKVRRKKDSGYAYEEDIPSIPTRPRLVFLTPTFSAVELVQGLGRAARITSLSDTRQLLLFYRGTIEERVAHVVSAKLKCLKKVVRQRESWEDVIMQGRKMVVNGNTAEGSAHIPDEEEVDGSDLLDLDDSGEDNDEDNP